MLERRVEPEPYAHTIELTETERAGLLSNLGDLTVGELDERPFLRSLWVLLDSRGGEVRTDPDGNLVRPGGDGA